MCPCLKKERELIYPKVEEINFSLDNKEDIKTNTMDLYNDLLTSYNNQVSNLSNFEIISMGFYEALIKKTLRLVNLNEYKRNQFCPIIRVSTKAFGIGRRLPIVAKYLS